ncbi:MAG TPA: host-nuclease inhibitor Gam family protein [Ferruginibacter sp.]|nr:host-nuclease inhibitor Gam family protein [Ferruginibacter sp.]HMP20936.1 host-nuclease inhibitor Gam family protein [Ferruginibacter sp.]
MAREKKKVIANVSREDAEQAMSSFAAAANEVSSIEAKMNQELQEVRERYQDKLNKYNDIKDEQVQVLEVYAYEQKDNWGKRKSMDMLHGTIGFRTGTPKVKFDKGFNSKSVTAILQEQFPEFVRTVVDMDKEKLIASREDDGFDTICKKAHIQVVQEETFFVESKAELLQDV